MDEVSAGVDVFMGFASWASSRPRSKVYGVGRSTATSSFVLAFPAGRDIVILITMAVGFVQSGGIVNSLGGYILRGFGGMSGL